jgi:SAM-dependent methyltransferase
LVEDTIERFADRSLDVVISSMVLEHLRDPFAAVRSLAVKLKPKGQFLFSTIVRDSTDAKLYGRYWAGFDFPRHMVFFTRTDIIRMLEPWFDSIILLHQVAPIDFVRGSMWRRDHGEGTLVDSVVLTTGDSLPFRLLNLLFAYVGRTTRVSVSCRRKHAL